MAAGIRPVAARPRSRVRGQADPPLEVEEEEVMSIKTMKEEFKALVERRMKETMGQLYCPWCGGKARFNTGIPTITVNCDSCEATTEIRTIT